MIESEKRKKERAKLINDDKITSEIIEDDENIQLKLLNGESYTKEDLEKCVASFCSKHQLSQNQVLVFESFQDFDTLKVPKGGSVYIIYQESDKFWVLFYVVKTENFQFLYRSPDGREISKELHNLLSSRYSGCSINSNILNREVIKNEACSGPISLRNLQLLVQKRPKTEDLQQFLFSNLKDLGDGKVLALIKQVSKLSENKNFIRELKKFIDCLPTELGENVRQYLQIMEKELEKGENEFNAESIKQAKNQHVKEEEIRKINENYDVKKTENNDYDTSIQRKFPNEMRQLSAIFNMINNAISGKALSKLLKTISKILNINSVKLKMFFETHPGNEDTKDKTLKPYDIKSMELPPRKQSKVEQNTPLEELLTQIQLGMDPTVSDSQLIQNPEILVLDQRYHKVKSFKKWEIVDIQEINNWAKMKKGMLGSSDEDVCETIAIMDRAFNLTTGGFHLRDTQILAVLAFFSTVNEGKLCQIQTGEGKTVIVSLLAVIKVLQGQKVDVITSNTVLASDGLKETKNFFTVFDITVATNNPDDVIDYTADVLYGTISIFQFDYLKESFEGFDIRKERRFGQVILDEVDSMLIDNGGHIAKLATPYPGMEYLKYIYIKIWQELQHAEAEFIAETQAEIMNIRKEPNGDEKCQKYIETILFQERRIIKEKIKNSNCLSDVLVPPHLREYVQNKLEIWMQNALHAKYNCHEFQQYTISKGSDNEEVVTPVDYLNTGVNLRNTIWSNGLHQFIQIKHNLQLTFESLTSSFISNLGYINKYEDKNIFGMTGTLGSRAEQELLSSAYKINYAKLPTYKRKQFRELPGIIIEDSSWDVRVTVEVLRKIDENRAVLVICETQQDLMTLNENLKMLKYPSKIIRKYAIEDEAKATKKKVSPGDVILATNIAGRGTNFKTEKILEQNGGLHVCVGFLPYNLRVEEQAFGRTSRQGNQGTAQLIIRASEVEELSLDPVKTDFNEIKKMRDELERQRLDDISRNLVHELNFKDQLFALFSEFYRNLKLSNYTKAFSFVLNDLQEFWAFWLEKKDFTDINIKGTTPLQEFQQFQNEAARIISGKIEHNPYYNISLAEYYLELDNREKAKTALQHAITLSEPEFLSGAHLKLFEIAIANGEQVKEVLRKALADVIFISVERHEGYKTDALEHLKTAISAIRQEIFYFETHFFTDQGSLVDSFEKILDNTTSNNLLLKHFSSKYTALKIHESSIDGLIKSIQNMPHGCDLNGRAPCSLEKLSEIDPRITEQITDCELSELKAVGVETLYAIKEVKDIPSHVITLAVVQIGAGIATLVVGLAFLPCFPLVAPIAGTLISEGIMDLVTYLLLRNEYDKTEYMTSKFIAYGVTLLTFGISAVVQSVSILTKAIQFCRKLSKFLRECKHLQALCNKMAKVFVKLEVYLTKLLAAAKLSKLSKAQQLEKLIKMKKSGEISKIHDGLQKLKKLQKLKVAGKLRDLTRAELVDTFVKNTSIATAKKISKTILMDKVVKPIFFQGFQKLIHSINNSIKNDVKKAIIKIEALISKLKKCPKTKIDEVLTEFLDTNNMAFEVAKGVGFGMLEQINSFSINGAMIGFDQILNSAKIGIYTSQLVQHLDGHLQEEDASNNTDIVIDEIASKAADKMCILLLNIIEGAGKFVFETGKFYWIKYEKKKAVASDDGSNTNENQHGSSNSSHTSGTEAGSDVENNDNGNLPEASNLNKISGSNAESHSGNNDNGNGPDAPNLHITSTSDPGSYSGNNAHENPPQASTSHKFSGSEAGSDIEHNENSIQQEVLNSYKILGLKAGVPISEIRTAALHLGKIAKLKSNSSDSELKQISDAYYAIYSRSNTI